MKLNQEQQEAVRVIDRPLLVLAGAGSGKTRVITEKIRHLVEQYQYDPRSIFAVTFTNKAANEMRERLQSLLKGVAGQRVHVATFHTLGLMILKQHGGVIGLRKGFSIYDQNDSHHLMETILEDADREQIRQILDHISSWKNEMLSPQAILSAAEDERMVEIGSLYQQYQEQLHAYNAVDFDDLVLQSYRLLKEHETVRSYWRRTIRYLLVDEYQDTNRAQYELIKEIIGMRSCLTVVGDDDQSIYAWRGARPENLHELHRDFPNLHLIKLEQNYRSTGHILNAANHLIAKNPHLYDKRLWSALGDGEKIAIHDFKSAEAEAEFVAMTINHNQLINGARFDDHAILYRGNHQSSRFERALGARGIPYRVVGGESFFQQPEVSILLSYLKLIGNPEDNASLLRVINLPKRAIGAAALKKLAEFATTHGYTLFETLGHPQLHTFMGRRVAFQMAQFYDLILECQNRSDDLGELFDYLVENLNYYHYLQEESPKGFERKIRNVEALGEWFYGAKRSLSDILSHLTLIAILESDERTQDRDAVTLMTFHSAKGLEFPTVFMVGAEEDIIPHRNSIDDGMVDEERRLFYVGITRAQRMLYITYCRQRMRYQQAESCTPSRFLSELPSEDILWAKDRVMDREERRKNTSKTVQGLQAMLSSLER